jgi:hypothetical protein
MEFLGLERIQLALVGDSIDSGAQIKAKWIELSAIFCVVSMFS